MHQRTNKRTRYSTFTHWAAKGILRLFGWTYEGVRPADTPKCVILGVPHTSNWDLATTLLGSMSLQIPAVFMMKDSWFRGIFGPLFYWMGGIPVNRREQTNTVDQIVQAFQESDQLYLVIAPEGTRKQVTYWKLGFYWIAVKAGVPILPGYVDYKQKRVGVGPLIYPTGDLEADFETLRAFYQAFDVVPDFKRRPDNVLPAAGTS